MVKKQVDYEELWKSNPMLKPFVEKLVVNISVGKGGEELEKAKSVIQDMTQKAPVSVKAKKSIKEWGIRKNQNIAAKVTLRRDDAIEFLKRVLFINDNRILRRAFDNKGNFSLGVDEHIKLPGVKYNPEFGIFGFNVSVRLARPGYRIKNRKKDRRKVGKDHYISRNEARYFVSNVLKAEIVEVMEERYY